MNDLDQFNYEMNLNNIAELFNLILDKLDKLSAKQRSRKIKISINDSTFPSLYIPKEFDDEKKIKEAILLLVKLKIFHVEESKKDSVRELNEKENAKLVFNYDWEDNIRSFYNRNTTKDNWVEIVNTRQFDESIKNIILKNRIIVKSRTNAEIIDKLNSLLTSNNINKSIRYASAKYFWGLSKVLDSKIEIIEHCKLRASPIMLHVKSFSNDFKNILFIENLDTYSEIINSKNYTFENFIIIYSSGFKAAAKRLRTVSGSKLFFSDNCLLVDSGRDAFRNWLYKDKETEFNVYFWGDLDYSGVHIFNTIKNIFPELQIWEPGYKKMLDAITINDFHEPKDSDKELQIKPHLIEDQYVDEILIPVLENERFVDQEYVDIEDL